MEENIRCQICNKDFKHLGSHIYHKHGMLARDYKEKFELPYNFPLTTKEIQEKKKLKAEMKPTWQKNFIKAGTKYRFKKGQRMFRRISKYELRRMKGRIEEVNLKYKSNLRKCPICKVAYEHMESHLFNKHGMVKVK